MVIGGLVVPAYAGRAIDSPIATSRGDLYDLTLDLYDLTLEDILNLKVNGASLHEQRLKDAPENVAVISAHEIRKFGYRTLAGAFVDIRGFYTSPDDAYASLGVRGFSLPGDYDTRVIVMINSHSIADEIYHQSTWSGNDFPVDADLVEQIEVVRGASLCGSKGMRTTTNIVTKLPDTVHGWSACLETDSLSLRKVEGSTSIALPHGANLLFPVLIFNNSGAHQPYLGDSMLLKRTLPGVSDDDRFTSVKSVPGHWRSREVTLISLLLPITAKVLDARSRPSLLGAYNSGVAANGELLSRGNNDVG